MARARPVTLREWLQEKEFSLSLSSSFFGMYAHLGLLSALNDVGALPSHVSGSSAGALLAALWASGLSVSKIKDIVFGIQGWELIHIFTWPTGPGIFDVHAATMRLLEGEDVLPVQNIEDCHTKLSISSFNLAKMKPVVYTRGDLRSALAASMSVPLLFRPVWRDGMPHLDGFVGDMGGLNGLDRDGRVLYHHASNLPVTWSRVEEFPDSVAIHIEDLPWVLPWSLRTAGKRAFEKARAVALIALRQPVTSGCWISIRGDVHLDHAHAPLLFAPKAGATNNGQNSDKELEQALEQQALSQKPIKVVMKVTSWISPSGVDGGRGQEDESPALGAGANKPAHTQDGLDRRPRGTDGMSDGNTSRRSRPPAPPLPAGRLDHRTSLVHKRRKQSAAAVTADWARAGKGEVLGLRMQSRL